MIFTSIAQAKKQTGLSYLGSVNSSAKMMKNNKIGMKTYSIYLAPNNISGYNVCSHSTPECRIGCLNTSGRAGMEIISNKTTLINCRIKKSQLFFEHTDFFMNWLIAEIKEEHIKAINNDFDFSVCLNCTSDINWANVLIDNKNIFQIFPDIQFYDYTKNHNKFNNILDNYHLTMSYTGNNWQVCEALLQRGFNVAMIFDIRQNKELPKTINGYNIIDGDINDYRPNNGNSNIIGLRWKVIANKQANDLVRQSKLVIKPEKLFGFITYNVDHFSKISHETILT